MQAGAFLCMKTPLIHMLSFRAISFTKIMTTALLMVLGFATAVIAAPRVPVSDSDVLERLPTRAGDSTARTARALREALARDNKNLAAAVAAAQLHIANARRDSDPRQLGQAEAVLSPWWGEASPPIPVLVLRATIRQSVHEFAAARRDLEQAVKRDPKNGQAWLTLSTVQQVTGDLAGAAQSCERLSTNSILFIAITCRSTVDAANGRAVFAYQQLDILLDQSAGIPSSLRSWAITLQAEIAQRLGKNRDAERLFRASLAIDGDDAYTIAAYADFLLDGKRAEAVLKLIPADTRADNLLLRRAIAAKQANAPDANTLIDLLQARFDAAHARGSRVHLREEARFELQLRNRPAVAQKLAQENWQVQKEPADVRILIESAVANADPAAAAEAVLWVRTSRLEDVTLRKMIAALGKDVGRTKKSGAA